MTGSPRAGLRVLVRYGRAGEEPDPDDLAVLAPEERRRARRFRQPHRGAAYAAAHATARRCLAERAGGTPEGLRFGRLACQGCGATDHGRPFVEYPATSWESSLSRSGAHWLFAAVDGAPVGADIERIRPFDLSVLGRTVLSGAEAAYLAGLEPELRHGAFMRCWTRKEAVVKASGIGIEADLRRIEVQPWRDTTVVAHRAPGCAVGRWAVCDLPVADDCCAALAVPIGSELSVDLGLFQRTPPDSSLTPPLSPRPEEDTMESTTPPTTPQSPDGDVTPRMLKVPPHLADKQLAFRMGIEIVSWDPKRLVGTMPVEGNQQPFGWLHGGANAVLAETLGSVAASLHAAPKGTVAGLELSCTHHRPAWSGLVTGVCTPLHLGSRVATYEIAINDEQGNLTCSAKLTCIINSR